MFVLATFAVLTGTAGGDRRLRAAGVRRERTAARARDPAGAWRAAGLARRLVTTQAVALAAAGVVLGLVCMLFSGGWLEVVLFQTRTSDIGAMGTAAAILLLAALVASLAPAFRAARVPPVEGLKAE